MQWIIRPDDLPAREGIHWARHFLEPFNLSTVEWFKIERGRSKHGGVYGRCYYATKERPTCRISCLIAGPFPCRVLTRRSPIYRRPDGTWPELPHGCLRGLRCHDRRTGRWWTRVIGQTTVRDCDEAVVWIVAHEAFHFLRRTRQIEGRNTEIHADRFADERLAEFQAARQPKSLFDQLVVAPLRKRRLLRRATA